MPRGLKIQSKFTEVTCPAEVDDNDNDQCRRQDANQTKVATITTAGESESDSDDSDSDTDSDSDEDEFDNDITAVTGDTPGTFDDEALKPEDKDDDVKEEEVDEILNLPQ